nr:calcineurin B-like protein 4 [Tanacetum cinerariifolium]
MNVEDLVVRLRIEEDNRLAQKDTYTPYSAKANMIEHAMSSSRSNPKGKGKDKRKNDKKSKEKSEYLAPKAGIVKQKFQGTCYNCDQPGHRAANCKMPKRVNPRQENMVNDDVDMIAMLSDVCAMIPEVNLVGTNHGGWWIDTGATRHVCVDKSMFHSFIAVDNGQKLYMGNSATADIKGEGDVILKMTSEKELKLTNVLKDEAIDKFVLYKTEVENQLGKKIKVVQSDRGGEYVSPFIELHAKHRIRHEFTAPYSPQQNGIVKMKNRTLKEMVTAMLISSAKVAVPAPKAQKIRSNSVDCIFIGYVKNSSACHFIIHELKNPDIQKNTVMESRNTSFFEHTFPCLSKETGSASRLDDEVVQDKRQRDDNDLQDGRQDQTEKEEVEPIRSKKARNEKSFGPDFVSFMVENEPTSYREAYFYVYLLKSKDEAIDKFVLYKTEVENQLGKKIKVVRSDRGGEYVSSFAELCAKHGVRHEFTALYLPHQNGIAERKNRTLKEMVTVMLISSGMSQDMWGEAILTAKVVVPAPKAQKIGPKYVDCIFIGYAKNSSVYRFIVHELKNPDIEIESRNDSFFEHIFPCLSKETGSSSRLDDEVVQDNRQRDDNDLQDERQDQIEKEKVEPKRSKRVRNEKSFGPDFVSFMVENEPTSYREAVTSSKGQQWREAIKSEIKPILQNHTWELVDLPPGCKPLGYKWIFKKKMKADGTIDKYKARLVIKGFRQCEGLDYFDTYSPITRITSIRMILVIAALRNLEIHQMDVKTAFLNGDLEEETYINQPVGFIAPGQEGKDMGLADVILGIKIIRTQNGIVLSQAHYVDKILNTHNAGDSGQASTPIDTSTRLDLAYAVSRLREFIKLDKCDEEAEWLRQFVEDIPRWPKPVTAISIHCDSKSAMGRAKSTIYNGKFRHIRRRYNSIRQLLSTKVISIDYVASKDNIADPFTKGLSREMLSSRKSRLLRSRRLSASHKGSKKNETDHIEAAKITFAAQQLKGRKFQLGHVWRILKGHSKWDALEPLDTKDHTDIFGPDTRPCPAGKNDQICAKMTGSSGGSASGSISDFVSDDLRRKLQAGTSAYERKQKELAMMEFKEMEFLTIDADQLSKRKASIIRKRQKIIIAKYVQQ